MENQFSFYFNIGLVKIHYSFQTQNMKRIFLLFAASLSLIFLSPKTFSQQCADCRYVSPIFDSVTMETIQFGRGTRANGDTQELFMDIYQPYGDTMSNRPLAIFAFGGAFITGSRDDWYVKLVCEHLTRSGYVVAAIDYRIYDDITQMVTEIFSAFPPQQMRIFFRPMQDMRGAVQYFKADYSELGNSYRIDTSKILIGGASSGAITSLMTAYCDKDSEMAQMAGGSLAALNALGGFYSSSGFYPNYSWHAAGTFNVSGALINANWIEPGDVPVICAHGDADQVVPYKKGGFAGLTLGTFDMEGSYLVDSVARSKGVCSYLYNMEGRDHPSESMGIEYFMSVVYRMMLRMKAVISNQSFCCALNVDITPGDTLLYLPNAPVASTLTAVVTNDNGNASIQWCTMPCSVTSSTNSITVTADSTLKYVAATVSEGNCLSADLHIVYDSTQLTSLAEEIDEINFFIYPQPASSALNIVADLSKSKTKSGVIELRNVFGQKVFEQSFYSLNQQLKTTIDVSTLPAANYLLSISMRGLKVGSKRIMVTR